MHLYAILSDIHGNNEALQAVVSDAHSIAKDLNVPQKNFHFISLGDVVDYGPQPNECMDWVQNNVTICVQGNHDLDVAAPDDEPPTTINFEYWPITLWSRKVLKPHHKAIIGNWKPEVGAGTSHPVDLPGLESFAFFHSNLNLRHHHIKRPVDAKDTLATMSGRKAAYGLFGHTHHQSYFKLNATDEIDIVLACETEEKPIAMATTIRMKNALYHRIEMKWRELPPDSIINPGSVGQPRYHEYFEKGKRQAFPRAGYVLLKQNGSTRPEFQFRRVAYNIEETIRHLLEVRWNDEDPAIYHSIYKDEAQKTAVPDRDPRLEEALANISQTLPVLIKETLIPKLRYG